MREHQIVGSVLLILALLPAWNGIQILVKYQNKVGARAAGGYLILLGLLLIGLTVAYWFKAGKNRTSTKETPDGDKGGNRYILTGLALIFGYVLLMDFLGYLLSTAVFLILYLRIFGAYRWTPIVIGSLIAAAGSAYGWERVGLTLPGGILPWP